MAPFVEAFAGWLVSAAATPGIPVAMIRRRTAGNTVAVGYSVFGTRFSNRPGEPMML